MPAKSLMRKGANRFARGMNKTLKGASKKFGVLKKPGMMRDFGYENAVVGGGLASDGMAASKKAKQEKLLRRMPNVAFSGKLYEDLVEFSIQPGIDPNVVQSLIAEAARIEQEGQTKIVISRQLFEQLQAALQNFQMQKQQVDGQAVERIQQQGFSAGFNLINL